MKTIQQKAVEFVFIVKERFVAHPLKFNQFANIVSDLGGCISSNDRDCLVSQLKNMFVDDHQDLLSALNEFLPKHMMTLEKKDDNSKYSWLLSDSPNEFFNKIRDRCIEKNDKDFSVLIKFSELIVSCHEKKITAREVDLEFQDLFEGDPDLYVECTRLLADLWDNKSDEKSGLDYSGFGFLNKRRKVVRRRTLYEKTMAVKEFYLYEMELAFSRIESTIMKLDGGDPESFGECLNVHDSKCIMELYKGSDSDNSFGEELVEILLCDPVKRIVARGVVLERLRKKLMQLEEQKICLDQVWIEIFEDIREKGVVSCHRGFLEKMTELSKSNYCDSD